MKPRIIRDGVYALGAIDWDRRLFDSLIPLPDGTSYNAYLIHGSEKTALLDTVDPSKMDALMSQLEDVPEVDYVVSHHAEQDHSGTIPAILEKYGGAKVVSTARARGMLVDLLAIPEERIVPIEDGETLSLGDKTLEFINTPWVHWPETMVSYLREDRILFSCDFFGSHLATTELYASESRILEPAKRYYAEIMMPFRKVIQKNLEKIAPYELDIIAPSHGPLYDRPAFIIDAYRDWVSSPPRNIAVVAYVSMHGSTARMVSHLVGALAERGVAVEQFELATADIGKLAVALVDAATIVLGTPTVLGGPHPNVVYAAYLANALKPKVRFVSVIGSYGWGGKTVEQLTGAMAGLEAEVLDPVLCKGLPRQSDFEAIDNLAASIASKHRAQGIS
jgi:flavorubredoxin